MPDFKLGELFCGPGGMALGAQMAESVKNKNGDIYTISHVWGVDKDPVAIDTYNANDLGTGVVRDAVEFAQGIFDKDKKNIHDFKKINALAFGFPCNDFSLVGKQKGFNGKFGELYKAGVEAIRYANPDWFVAENVSGIHSANSGTAFRNILFALENSGKYGYNLTVHLYKFEEYGVPQNRHRYIIVGIRKDLKKVFKVPLPTHLSKPVSVKKALGKAYLRDVYNREFTKQSKTVENRLLLTPPGKNAWYLDELALLSPSEIRNELKSLPWYESTVGKMTNQELKEFVFKSKLNCNRAKMSHIYRRLEADKPSYTLTGSGGGGTHVYHWDECRALTNRERARLQGFPDDFIFIGRKEQVRKQIGMAVPPIGAKIIFEAILKTMAGINYDYVEPSIVSW